MHLERRQFEIVPIDSIQPMPGNPRKISEAGLAKIRRSLREFNWTAPCLAQRSTRYIIAGNTRWRAAKLEGFKECPVVWLDVDDATARKINMADNRLGEEAEWDTDALLRWAEELTVAGEDLTVTGFEAGDLDGLLAGFPGFTADDLQLPGDQGKGAPGPAQVKEQEIPEPPKEARTRPGDVWLLGRHRLMCGDSTRPEDVARLMNGEKAHLLHADPPYGMGKERDGVANDNLYREKLDRFQLAWWRAFRPYLHDNASAYIWGNAEDLWRLWLVAGLKDTERLTMRNEIVWAKVGQVNGKPVAIGMLSDLMRCYPVQTERCLFFMLGEQEMGNNADQFWEGFEPIRAMLEAEVKKMGWGRKDIQRITGVGMYGHWFTRSQWQLIPRHHYEKLQEAAQGKAFTMPYDEILYGSKDATAAYEALKRGFYASRAYFDNTHEQMTDVWLFPPVIGEERFGHATPKPVAMMARAIKTSCPPKGLVVEPFGGTGATLIAAEQVDRTCYTMELEPSWCDVIVERWERLTGQKAIREGAENG